MLIKRKANLKVALITVIFIFSLIIASAVYWNSIIKPVLSSDMQSIASSMASARANELATQIGQGEHSDDTIETALTSMLAYTYERTQKQFFTALHLEVSDSFKNEQGLSKTVYAYGNSGCTDCFLRDYPIYSPSSFMLIGVLTIEVSNTQSKTFIQSVQRLFLTGALIVLISAAVILILIWNMTADIDLLNMRLEEQVDQRTQSLREEVEEHAKTQKRLHVARDEMQRLERSRISNRLHDGVGQVLQAVKLGLQRLSVQIDDENKVLVNELVNDTGEAISIIRDFCSELRPQHLERMSLGDALFNHVERLNRRVHAMELVMHEHGEHTQELSMVVKEQLFLICAEAMNNAIKYSEAKNVVLTMVWAKDRLELMIKDNGKGFDETPSSSSGFGLSLMLERCERIGATLQTRTEKNHGVTVRCELPFK